MAMTIPSNDASEVLVEQVRQAIERKAPLRIVGGNSKASLGNKVDHSDATELAVRSHEGIISYDPTELVVTVRAGTPLADLNDVLSEAGQMLPFDPPDWSGSTIGGVIACGLSGPRRPFSGAARDYVLGTRVINGQAQNLSFGGQVMKNVAGYDVSRIQVGAWGTLGVLLDVSMKVLPLPELELTIRQTSNRDDLQGFAPLMRKPLPLSGAMLIDSDRYLRLSGSDAAVRVAAAELGGDIVDNNIWQAVRDHTHPFFLAAGEATQNSKQNLWRISVADYSPALTLSGDWLYEWAGAQRWLLTSAAAEDVFRVVKEAQGHATRYNAGDMASPAFQPLNGTMKSLQSRLRDSFDPLRLFNRGRFHPELDVDPRLASVSA
ncbi:MAG: glycolate oxidase subunit GlcE [Granulosicoccus sp.]